MSDAAGTVLVLRPGAIGDTILTLPALRSLRAGFPDCRLHLVGNAGAGAVLREAGVIDALTDFDASPVAELFSSASEPSFLAEARPIKAAVAWLSDPGGSVRMHLEKSGACRALVVPSRPGPAARQHVSDYLLDTLAPWRLPPPRPEPLRLQSGSSEERKMRVLVHPGSGSGAKNWSAAGFAAVIRGLERYERAEIAVLRGPADEAACAALLGELGDGLRVLSPVSVLELARVLSDSAVLLGNDSGVSHLAAALGVPTVVVFGPTDPAVWSPRGEWVRVLPFSSEADEVVSAVRDALDRSDPSVDDGRVE